MGLDIDLYTPKIDISDDGADDIIIEITGLKSISKFIGLEDTPLYYDNGKFFKVEDNKIVYTNIEWKDISGDISESPEIIKIISDLVNEVASDIVDERINLHNLNTEAHPYIQNIIHENYVTLDTKIDDTKEELSQDISNLNDALNQEISDRETADNALSEDIQEEILARIEGDATLQGEIDTLNTNLQNEIDARIEGDTNLSNSLDELSNNLIQEVLDRQEQDSILQEQITSNYNTLDDKIDTEISNRTSADTTLQGNIDAEALARQNADTTLQNNIDELTQTVEDNNTAVNSRIDETNDTVSDLSDTVTSNYNTLDDKINTEISDRTSADTTLQNNIDAEASTRQDADSILQGNIDTLSDTVSSNYTTLDGKITNLTSTVNDNYTELDGRITTNTNNISTINSKIPNQASSSNQLADKDFVNSSIATNTANFIGTFNSVAELEAYSGTLTNNDYAFVATIDSVGNTLYDRYKYSTNTQEWLFEYELNNSSFTAVQWASINSGATTENINQITTNTNNITDLQTNKQDKLTAGANIQINNNVISATDTTYTAGSGISIENNVISNTQTSAVWGNIQGTLSDQTDLQTVLNSKQDNLVSGENIKTINSTSILGSGNISVATSAQGALADTALQPNDNISELTNDANYITSADLPIVNNGVLTIQVNGDNLATFSANQAGNTTANIVVPDSATWGNITGTLSNQTDLQNALNDKYDASNPDGFITSADLPTNHVTTNTIQTISARKTFTGEKAIYFKQNATSDKLGFTLYNPSNTELGAFEWRPNTINSGALLNVNAPYASSNYVGFRYWGTAVNIIAPKVARAGNYYIPTHFTDGTNTVTANNVGTVNITSLLPDLSNYQPLLVSGSNIKTINGASILGSGNLTLDGLPSQTGQSGKFLTTDGTDASWAETTKVTIRDWSVS